MPTYLVTNRAPAGMTPSPEGAAAWSVWFEQLGDHLVDRGNPAFARAAIGNCGRDTVLGGYTLIEANNLEHAAELAQRHPLLSRGGGVEIGELTPINAGRDLAVDER